MDVYTKNLSASRQIETDCLDKANPRFEEINITSHPFPDVLSNSYIQSLSKLKEPVIARVNNQKNPKERPFLDAYQPSNSTPHIPLLAKQNSTEETTRDIRRDQLTQLIGGKIRDGELLLTLGSGIGAMKQQSSSWRIGSVTQGSTYSVLNEISLLGSFDCFRKRIIGMGVQSTSSYSRSVLENLTKICCISHEQINSEKFGAMDYVLLRLEKQFKDGSLKIVEMSLQDKKYPSAFGFNRDFVELRYLKLVPDVNDPHCCKLWVVHSFRLKTQKGSTQEIEAAEEKNSLFVQTILKELQ